MFVDARMLTWRHACASRRANTPDFHLIRYLHCVRHNAKHNKKKYFIKVRSCVARGRNFVLCKTRNITQNILSGSYWSLNATQKGFSKAVETGCWHNMHFVTKNTSFVWAKFLRKRAHDVWMFEFSMGPKWKYEFLSLAAVWCLIQMLLRT